MGDNDLSVQQPEKVWKSLENEDNELEKVHEICASRW